MSRAANRLRALGLLAVAACEGRPEPSFRVAPLTASEPAMAVVEREPVRPSGGEAQIPALVVLDPHARPLVLTPADLGTSTYGTLPAVAVPRRGLSEAEVAEISARFDLVTWPEREPIEITPVYLDEALPPAAYSRIVLSPTEPLENRWYAVRARIASGETVGASGAPASDDLTVDAPRDSPDEAVAPRDGDYAISRFHVGPNLVVRRVHARAREDGRGDLQVVFSEPVVLSPDNFTVETSEGSSCALQNSTAARPSAADDDELAPLPERGELIAWFVCDRLAEGGGVTVRTRGDVPGADGRIATDASGDALDGWSLTLDAIPLGAPEPRHDLVGDDPRPSATADHPTVATFVPRFGLVDGI